MDLITDRDYDVMELIPTEWTHTSKLLDKSWERAGKLAWYESMSILGYRPFEIPRLTVTELYRIADKLEPIGFIEIREREETPDERPSYRAECRTIREYRLTPLGAERLDRHKKKKAA